ncbi:MAG: hypothetical protein M9954_00275 [Cyclobacteriaceae bacterium]|nr:hypothetical protein [Cyclobacteriaceae bacterium]MCB0498667.1 hypothetical protein [Cyclobacteriaceae bacterium]MCO5270076.1 hypothetical protein [Cyclobacteriaceae bacterium]MCW5903184.1 hypothetical protein [Cyclobacteriaceae bacterium]HPI78999.1 hypothetical protein [Cyclobacteriaceae bacterium]
MVKEMEGGPAGQQAMGSAPMRQLREILINHHRFVRETVPLIQELLHLLTAHHVHGHPELACMGDKFSVLAEELYLQIKKEEEGLLPLLERHQDERAHRHIRVNTAHEHAFLKGLLRDIRHLSQGYHCPASACKVYGLAYQRLRDFDAQLTSYLDTEGCFQ